LIEIRNLTFRYNGTSRPALQDINLEIPGGEFVLITGPSGSGKSSLCRCLNGLIPHFYGGEISGRVNVVGLDVLKCPTKQLASKVGMVFQDPENQLVTTDVEREIAFGLENLGFPRDIIAKRLEESLYTLGISDLRGRQLHELSGGEKQKVAIASVLALHPDVLVLDEPTSELDPHSAEEVLSIVHRLNDELGITVILLEHRLDRVVHMVDRMMVLNEGRIVADGDPRDVLTSGGIDGTGVGPPPIVRLSQSLRAKGIDIEKIPLTVKEGRATLGKAFERSGNGKVNVAPEVKSEPVIGVNNLWHVYPQGLTALKGINLEICRGEFVAIMGRNASGKTTLLKHFNGLLQPTRGTVKVSGIYTKGTTVSELSRIVGMVFQNPNDHIFADTVEEEVAFVMKNRGNSSHEIKLLVEQTLETFGIAEYRRSDPRSLSSGQKQRVALASILVARPQILVLDEPTRGLEHRLKSELMDYLKHYREDGNTVILVTHDIETVAENAGRVILLSEGKVVVDGNKHDVLSQALLFSPQINRLVHAFEKYGAPSNILTVEEALGILS